MDPAYASTHRVALITGVLDLGGTTTFLCNLGGELTRRGVPTCVLSFERNNPLAHDFSRLGIPVFTSDETRLIYEDRLELILQQLRKFQPTVAVANLSATSFEVLRYVPPGVFRVGTAQSHDPGVYRLLRKYAGQVDVMAAVSRTIEETLRSLPEFSGTAVRYQPYGVALQQYNRSRAADGKQPLRIVYLGRLQREQKRVQLFPEILAQLRASSMPFHWTIAGDGPEREALQRTMEVTTGAQTVSFPGKVLYDDVPRLLSGHDIFLLASDYEGLPLSLLEGMGQGLVPVVSDLPSGIREVVDESTGKLVAPDQVEGYAQAIVALGRNRTELASLSHASRERVQTRFSVSAMADRWLAMLPATPPPPPAWPTRWKIQPIIDARRKWWFSPPARYIRRFRLRRRR